MIGIPLLEAQYIKAQSRKLSREEQTLGQYIPLLYHYNMLQDTERVGAFQEAIQYRVQAGMRVVELGVGTGILSSFAARVGATVDAVERNPELVQAASKLVQQNGFEGQINVHYGDASVWIPEQPVDVVICEMLHVALVREKQTAVIEAFKRNYCRRFGPKLPLFIPEASILMVQPVVQDFNFHGYVAPVPFFHSATAIQTRTTEVASLQPYCSIFYAEDIPQNFSFQGRYESAVNGELNALRFVTQNALAIDLPSQRSINWPNQCMILPLDAPINVKVGDPVSLSVAYEAGCPIEEIRFSARVGEGIRLQAAG